MTDIINDDYDDTGDYDNNGNANDGNIDYDDNDGHIDHGDNDDIGQPLPPTVLALCLRSSHEV